MSSRFEPIAIVGAGALVPGAHDVAGFWQNVLSGKDLLTEVPSTHWLIDDYFHPDAKVPDKTYARRGAFLSPVAFDPMVFGIPPSLIPATDTSQLLALIVAQQVLDDVARNRPKAVDKNRISVILGVTGGQELMASMASRLQRPIWENALRQSGFDEEEIARACEKITAHYTPWVEATFPGLLGNVVAGRITNRLDLGGTNCIIDAACASALSAMHLAILELQTGHSDMVITGGVDTLNDLFMYMCFSKTPALSPTGDCRPFDAGADGTMLGEGLALFGLRKLADAERDGDEIYAVIKGLGSSSDGRSKSVYAPVSEGQAKALTRAYESAGYGPETIDLVEAHGTGTKAGDIAEINGLKMVFGECGRKDRQWCALGSVKSQIGHTKAAAGAAGLLKVALALHHRVLPPTIKVTNPNPQADFPNSPFYINTVARPWVRAADHPRRASVSAFGFGGSNFHMTVEEYTGAVRPPRMDAWPAELVLFQGEDKEAILAGIRAAAGKDPILLARASQLAYKKDQLCLGILVKGDLDKKLAAAERAISHGQLSPGVFWNLDREPGKIAFLFPGQGSQSIEMGAPIWMRSETALSVLDEVERILPGINGIIFPKPTFTEEARAEDQARLTRTENAQPALGAVSAAWLALLGELGLVADGAAGHSFGEITALYAAGVMGLSDLIKAARCRGEQMAAASKTHGAMLAVGATREAIEAVLAKDTGGVVIANHNAPDQAVLAGRTEAIARVRSALEARGMRTTQLNVATAFHSPVVADAAHGFEEYLKGLSFQAPKIPVYANRTAAPYGEGVTGESMPEALSAHLVSSVRFVEQIDRMYQDGYRTFIEVGPGGVLTGLVGRILQGRGHHAISLDAKGTDCAETLLAGLGRLAALGVALDFGTLWATRLVTEVKPPSKVAVMICGSNPRLTLQRKDRRTRSAFP